MNSELVAHQVRVTSDKLPSKPDHGRPAKRRPGYNNRRLQAFAGCAILDLSPEDPVDVTQLWSADKTIIELTMSGDMPAEDWFISLTMVLSGKITFKH
jgi:hypothetical protein